VRNREVLFFGGGAIVFTLFVDVRKIEKNKNLTN